MCWFFFSGSRLFGFLSLGMLCSWGSAARKPGRCPLMFVCCLCTLSQACSGPDVGLLVGAIIVALAILCCVYSSIARENRSTTTNTFTFVSILCSQFVTLFQMLGVMNMLSVAWPLPLVTIIEMGSLLNFRLEVLSIGCVVRTPPSHRYVANAFAFVVLTLCMVVIHFLRVMFFQFKKVRRAGIQQLTPALFGAVGTAFMALIISVCSAVVQPLRCDLHPNGLRTVQVCGEVVCWQNGNEHQHMVIVGAIASLMPLAFFSMCVTICLPKRLHQGDTVFLNTFAFLFFRFRPRACNYNYLLVRIRPLSSSLLAW